MTDDKYDKPNLNTGVTMHCVYWTTTTTKPTIIHPHIVFNYGRQHRHTQLYSDYIVCLLTYCAYWQTATPTIIRPHSNYWLTTTTTNPTIIRPHIVFTDGRQPRPIQPYYDHMWFLLTETTTNPTIIPVYRPYSLFTDGRQQQTKRNTTYWHTDGRQRQIQPYYDNMLCSLTVDNDKPTMIPPHFVFTNEQIQQQIQP